MYIYIFVKHNVIYATIWTLEEWSAVQKAGIDSLLCHKEHHYNEKKPLRHTFIGSFFVKT